MNKQEKILRFLQLMYSETYVKQQIQALELSFALLGGARPIEIAVLNELKQNMTKMLEELHQKYLPVYDRLYSEEHIDSLYEFYSSEACKFDLKIQEQLVLELRSAEIAWLDEISNRVAQTTVVPVSLVADNPINLKVSKILN